MPDILDLSGKVDSILLLALDNGHSDNQSVTAVRTILPLGDDSQPENSKLYG